MHVGRLTKKASYGLILGTGGACNMTMLQLKLAAYSRLEIETACVLGGEEYEWFKRILINDCVLCVYRNLEVLYHLAISQPYTHIIRKLSD